MTATTTRRPRYTTYRHGADLRAIADRTLPIIDQWAANLTKGKVTRSAALRELLDALTGPDREHYWGLLADGFAKRNPNYCLRVSFHAARDTILARLAAKSWTAA